MKIKAVEKGYVVKFCIQNFTHAQRRAPRSARQLWPEISAPFVVLSLINMSEVTEVTPALIPSKAQAK
jgi:hypothetical protein